MHRRALLKNSEIGIGPLAGMYGGVLEADGESSDQEPEVTAHPSANALVERRGNGFAALAGRSTDGKTVQIFIANYAIPDSRIVKMHAAGTETNAPQGIWLPPRTDIVYRDNAGYDLMVSSLPWGKKAFSLKHYRLSATQNLERVERRSGSGGSLRLSHPLPTDTVELIVMEPDADVTLKANNGRTDEHAPAKHAYIY